MIFCFSEMLQVIGVPLDKLKFVKGSNYQLPNITNKDETRNRYTIDLYRMCALLTSEHTSHVCNYTPILYIVYCGLIGGVVRGYDRDLGILNLQPNSDFLIIQQ
jgi:hypothetical protein